MRSGQRVGSTGGVHIVEALTVSSVTHHRRRNVLLALVAAALIAFPAPAAAGTVPTPPPPDSSSGLVGGHGFTEDTEGSPAGRCRYGFFVGSQYFNNLYRVGVVAPEAYARAGRTSQRIGFRVVIQVWDGNDWVFYARSSWKHRSATPATPAQFPRTGVPVEFVDQSPFRAKVLLRWYAPNGTTIRGRATLYPEWYRAFEQGASHEQQYRCGGTTG